MGLLMLSAVHHQRFPRFFWLMAASIFIDAVDGVLARRAMTKVAAPKIDGALLDNVVDYLTYAVAPAFFVLESGLVPQDWRFIASSMIVLASAYQFSQTDAKTDDYFFKGFPSFWNILIFYLFLWRSSPWVNLAIILILAALVFVPIKYVYPSRPDNVSRNPWLRVAVVGATILWGASSIGLLWAYPERSPVLMAISTSYVALYVLMSLRSTFGGLKTLFSRRSKLL